MCTVIGAEEEGPRGSFCSTIEPLHLKEIHIPNYDGTLAEASEARDTMPAELLQLGSCVLDIWAE